MKKILFTLLIQLSILSNINIYAEDYGNKTGSEQDWAIGAAIRKGAIPFATEETDYSTSFIPLLFFEGKYFFFRGIEGGFKLYQSDYWRLSALARLHFFDFPKQYQNQLQGDNVDWGGQARFLPWYNSYLEIELLTDMERNISSNVRLGYDYRKNNFRFEPYAELKIKSKDYNSYYFGLNQVAVNIGMDLSIGMIIDYRVWSNLYLFSAAKVTYFDKNVRNISFVDQNYGGEFYLGFGFSNNPTKIRKKTLKNKAYLRIAHGWATLTDFSETVFFKNKWDPYNNQLSSVFYGHPLTDDVLGIPLHMYLTAGFVWHWKSAVQQHTQEVVLAIKAYFVVPWPIRWRIGMAEGFSYVKDIPYVEQVQYDSKDYRPSYLLNYLDFSLDFNIGDIFGGESLKRMWLGYSVHHRSGIFESNQLFGRVNVGSNYPSLYLQMDF